MKIIQYGDWYKMIKRTTREDVLKKLEETPKLKLIDVGCGNRAGCEHADVLMDMYDWSSNYPNKKFIIHDVNDTPFPFEDDEFDFCFCSHLLEHVLDPEEFLQELMRISKGGYIEVPSPLCDNLVSGDDWGDPNGHKWWVFYDDAKETMLIRPRRLIVNKTIDIPELNKLYPFFRSSLVLELAWDDKFEFEMADEKYSYEDKNYNLEEETIDSWILGSSVLMGRSFK